jgi:hypothetical protein
MITVRLLATDAAARRAVTDLVAEIGRVLIVLIGVQKGPPISVYKGLPLP